MAPVSPKNGSSNERFPTEEPAAGVDAPSEEGRESSFASATSSGNENVAGLSYVGGQSPRAPLTILGAAIGYYEVLQSVSRKPLSNIRPPARGYDDEYQEMHFAPGDVTDIFGVPSNLTRARLRSFQNFRAATSTRLQNLKGRLRPGNYLPLQWTPRHVMLRDKFSFVLGVSHIMISAFWLGKSPSTFYQLYTFKATLLFIIRFFTYRRDKMHYYLLDFCYYANILLIIHAWCLPEWCTLEKILFAYATGPLAWTIVAFRNSMIFHSIDKMTSVFMHTFPMMVVWTQRWYPGDAKHWKTIASKSCESHTATVWELVVIPWIPYAVWAVAYYLKIFVISSKRIQERGYHTLFKYVIRKPNSFFGRANAILPRGVAPVVYMLWHILFCAVTFVVAMFCWHHYWVHTVFCCSVIAASVWNGGNYYFEVFAHSYLSDTGIPMKVPKARSHSVEVNHMVDPAIMFDESMRARSEGDMTVLADNLVTKELTKAMDAEGLLDAAPGGIPAAEPAADGKKDA